MWRVQTADDAEAFAQLMRRWEGPLRNLGTRMTGDAHRAQDLAQETFARLYARRARYEQSGKFSTYLWRIALNVCYDELRRQGRRRECSLDDEANAAVLDLHSDSSGPPPSAALEAREQADQVREALLRLPEGYRSVLVLRHYENLKFREIAEVLDIPEGTVKSRMSEGLNILGRLLRPLRLGGVEVKESSL